MEDMEKYVEAYVKLREKKREIEAHLRERLAPIEDALARISAKLNAALNEMGATSLKTPAGTVIVQQKKEVQVADWADFYDFVRKEDRIDMLQRRVSATAVMEYLTEVGDVPPGILVQTTRQVYVRAPSEK